MGIAQILALIFQEGPTALQLIATIIAAIEAAGPQHKAAVAAAAQAHVATVSK